MGSDKSDIYTCSMDIGVNITCRHNLRNKQHPKKPVNM